MVYHIYTNLIWDSFKKESECPLCEVKKVVEDGLIHEFLNDAVMSDEIRRDVNKKGFCKEHFDKLFNGKNKLSVALQMSTRLDNVIYSLKHSAFKGQSELVQKVKDSCIICDLLEESMEKYYMTVAYMFYSDREFSKTLCRSKGFCLNHYSSLIKYANHAGPLKKEYLDILKELEINSLNDLQSDLKTFCSKHDYRNANVPLGNAENALTRAREKFFGK